MNRTNLPHGWEKITLGDITENVMYGLNAKAVDFDGKKKYIRITDIDDNNKFSPDPLTSPDGSVDERYKVVKDDLLFVRTGATVGKSYLYHKSDGDVYFAGFLIRFHILNANPKFVFLQTQTPSYWNWVKSVSMRSGQPGINAEEYKKLPLILPPLDVQGAVIEFIEQWDTAIEKTEALIDAKERQFEWLVTRLINKSGHKKKQISNFVEEVSKRNRGTEIERVLSVTNHSGFVLPEDQFERRVASANVTNYKVVQQGQYAYNPSRINVGSIARLDKWSNGVLSPMYTVFKLDETVVDSDYFLHWLSSSEAKQRIKKSVQGSVRETVNFGNLGAIPIRLPDLSVQQNISDTLNTAKQEITLLKKLADQYRTQKRGLMQKLLTGKWRINL